MLSLSKGMCALSLQLNIAYTDPPKAEYLHYKLYHNAIENKIHQFVLYV